MLSLIPTLKKKPRRADVKQFVRCCCIKQDSGGVTPVEANSRAYGAHLPRATTCYGVETHFLSFFFNVDVGGKTEKRKKCGLVARARSLKTFLVHREGDKKTEGTKERKKNKMKGEEEHVGREIRRGEREGKEEA